MSALIDRQPVPQLPQRRHLGDRDDPAPLVRQLCPGVPDRLNPGRHPGEERGLPQPRDGREALVGGKLRLGGGQPFPGVRYLPAFRFRGDGDGVCLPERDRLNMGVELGGGDDRSRFAPPAASADVAGAAVEPLAAFGVEAEQVAAPLAPGDTFQQRTPPTRPRRAGVGDLGGLVQGAVRQRLVGGRVDPPAEPDLPEVHTVADNPAGCGLPPPDGAGDRRPRVTGGAHLERFDDGVPGAGVGLEPTVGPFAVADGDAGEGPHPSLDGASFDVGELVFVPVELHLPHRQDHVPGHPPFGGGGVEVLGDRDHLAACLFDAADGVQRVEDGHAGQPVELGDDDPLVGALFDAVEGLVEDRPVYLAAGHVEFWGEHVNVERTVGGVGSDAFGLDVGADEGVGAVAYAADSAVPGPHGGQSSVAVVRRAVTHPCAGDGSGVRCQGAGPGWCGQPVGPSGVLCEACWRCWA